MIRRPPRSTLFPTRRSSDLEAQHFLGGLATTLRGETGAGFDFGPHAYHARNQRVLDMFKEIAPVSDRKSTRLNSSHRTISYAVFCLKKKKKTKCKKQNRQTH